MSVFCQGYEDRLGWGFYGDTEYTEESPLVIDGAVGQIEINGLRDTTERRFLPVTGDLWENNKITMPVVGRGFIFRLDFKVKADSNNSHFDLLVDIGGETPVVISRKVLQIVKGINTEQVFSEVVSGFALDAFIENGGKIYIDSTDDNVELSIYDIGIHIMLVL